jgi:chromosome segregation ATPase
MRSFNRNYPSGRVFSGLFGANHSRVDDNTLNVAFARYVKPKPFAVTDLGKALQKIEDQLERANDELARARTEKEAADKALPSPGARVSPVERQLAETKTQLAKDRVEVWSTTVRSLESTKAGLVGLRASAAAASAAGGGAAISTQQQLNQLQTLDAIRDIPRR